MSDRTAGRIAGLGSDLKKMLREADRLLEAGRVEEFISNVYPLPELARITNDVGLKRYAERLQATPAMVAAMRRDLTTAAQTQLVVSGDTAEVMLPPLVNGDAPRLIKFERIEGYWRFPDALAIS